MEAAEVNGAEKQRRKCAGNPDKIVPFQWKPGQSGNPAGRPRRKSLTDLVRDIMEREGLTPDGRELCVDEALAETILTMALRGNTEILKELWSRLEGKPKEIVEGSVKHEHKHYVVPPPRVLNES